jgi:plastocyanin
MLARMAVAAATAMVIVGCAPDSPDLYTAEDDTITTRAPRDEPVGTDGTSVSTAEDVEPVAPTGETLQVRALDNTFRDAEVEIAAGAEVIWTNNGRNDHDVLPTDDAMDWGVEVEGFAPGDEYSHVFDAPGVYDYYCSIHGTKDAGMIGTVVVTAAEA